MTAVTLSQRALRIIEGDGPMTLNTFAKHIGIERIRARKLLANLVERDRIIFFGPRDFGTYRMVEPGEIVIHSKAHAPKPKPSPFGVVPGAIRARSVLATCWSAA